MAAGEKQRDFLFDNYKAMLIVLVVVGHFIELAPDENVILRMLKWAIFSFHMPAFVFISGYFSKRETSVWELIRKLAVPYLVFEVLYYLLYVLVIHKETELYLFYPKFSLWYLMALFVWKLITPWVRKVPGHLVVALALGLWVGCSGIDDNFLTIPRMLVFYPFFLLGVHFERRWVTKLRIHISEKTAYMMFVFVGMLLAVMAVGYGLSAKVFYGRYDYNYLQEDTAEGILIRLICYGISFTVTMLFLIVLPETKSRFSGVGSRTMPIYLFHGLFYSCMKAWSDQLLAMNWLVETVLLVGLSLAVVVLLSAPVFTQFMDWLTHVPIRQKRGRIKEKA
ncbi:acyltransferase family protein [Ruminococcus gauvreauii]|uniref:Acyltransferase family protein n=1 Tax=Ruminococcus gauvreauii TaxID=438033 RepID=A0ABY5VDH6_9FIRM|nr:acyltransferase family protein [Ruminococcus gauvreauii]UWP58367.1 acyltransferase family protein [Ruminococcus gauvreauii]